MSAPLAVMIANQLNRACALEITTTAIEAIEECLGEAMHTEKDLKFTSKMALEEEREHDLEVWRQAYTAYMSGYAVAEQLEGPDGPGRYVPEPPSVVADRALADYQKKREEMLNEHG